MNTNLLINNKSVTGDADPYQVINPFNSEVITEVNQSSIDQVNLAVQAAKDAFPKWSRTSPGERSSMLLKLAIFLKSITTGFFAFFSYVSNLLVRQLLVQLYN